MITPAYVHTMAEYNLEMNQRLYAAANRLSDAERRRDRGCVGVFRGRVSCHESAALALDETAQSGLWTQRENRFATDSALEGNGFELPVPRAMQERPKAMTVGFGCKPSSLDYLRLLSADITEGEPKRSLGTEALTRAEPEVRIHFPPAVSLQTFDSWSIHGPDRVIRQCPDRHRVAYWSPRSYRCCQTSRPL
jgi:hypothetical protein